MPAAMKGFTSGLVARFPHTLTITKALLKKQLAMLKTAFSFFQAPEALTLLAHGKKDKTND
jgi:hypothetical protein